MSNRIQAAKVYLTNLVLTYETLEAERQQLLAAASRIAAIQAEKAELLADAQEALTKLNALLGTSYTLVQIRAMVNARKVIGAPEEPPPVVEP